MEPLDCGDHSCDFAKDKSGMRTNGGCRCLKPLADTQRHKIKMAFRAMEKERDAALLQVRELKEGLDDYRGAFAAVGLMTATPRQSLMDLIAGHEAHHQEHHRKEEESNRLINEIKDWIWDQGHIRAASHRAEDCARCKLEEKEGRTQKRVDGGQKCGRCGDAKDDIVPTCYGCYIE